MERSEWQSYVESLDIHSNYPGIQGIGFSRVVSPQEKNEFIASVRNE